MDVRRKRNATAHFRFDLNVDPSCEDDDEDALSNELQPWDHTLNCDVKFCSNGDHRTRSASEFHIDLNRKLCFDEGDDAVLPELNVNSNVPRGQNSQFEFPIDRDIHFNDDVEFFSENDALYELDIQLPQYVALPENELEEEPQGDAATENESDEEIEDMTAITRDISEAPSQSRCKQRRFLTNEERRSICHILLHSCCHGKLKHGMIKKVASSYSVSTRIIRRVWHQIKQTGAATHRKTKNCGRKRIQLDIEKIREVPLSKLTTLRSLSCVVNIPKSTLVRLKKDGTIRRHSNAIKPLLKDKNMIARLKFCLSMLEEETIPYDPTFKSMYNIIHIDEKWFYMTKKSMNYYLLAEEEELYCTCKSKNFVSKVMFLVVVARPRFDVEGNEAFSGKIGVFPFVTKQPVKRNSVNRAAGTLETKLITSVNKDISRSFLIIRFYLPLKQNVQESV